MSGPPAPLDPFVMYTRAADARPSAVDITRWNDWQLWKQTAATATAEYKRALERTDPATIPDDVWQKTAEADTAIDEGHKSYAVVEKLVSETAKLRTDAERAVLQFANGQAAAMQAPANLNLNGHVTHSALQPSAHAPMSTSSASPPAMPLTNGSVTIAARAPKAATQSSAPKNASAPHVNNPVCDNCRLAGNVLCVRAAHPHHRRCTYCFENDTRCSFKESKAAAAAESGEPVPAPAVRKPRASQQPAATPVLVPVQTGQQSSTVIPVQNAPAPQPTATPVRQPKRKREPGTSEDSEEEMGQPARRYTPPAPPPFAAAVPMGVQAYGQAAPSQAQTQYQPQAQYQVQVPQVQYQPQPQPMPQPQRRAPTTVPIERRPSQATPQPRANGTNDLQRRVGDAQNLIRTIGFLFQQLDQALGGIAVVVGDNEDMHE